MTQPFLIAPVDTLIVSLAVLLVVRFAGLAIKFALTLRDLFLLALFPPLASTPSSIASSPAAGPSASWWCWLPVDRNYKAHFWHF